MGPQRFNEYAGIRRELEIGLCIAPSLAAAVPVAKAVAAYLDEDPAVTVRLAGLANEASRLAITLAVCVGTIEEIKAGAARSRIALRFLQRLVDDFASCDPAFVTLPATTSFEALVAERALAECGLAGTVERLVAIG